ncbi:PIN domain-containing protein [Pseudonocardia sp.]|uniref:PIN domain-containing protein n=1 Tax=Pseudonocardia sp. TaxID=60912 RepID=UPI003D0FF6CA
MTILLDTSAVIALGQLPETLVEGETLVVSAITAAELAYGLDVGDKTEADARAIRFRRVLESFEIMPFGVEEAKLYGVLSSMVRWSGRDPRPRRLDLQIAATAAAARFPVLTSNPRDFEGLTPLVDVIPIA